MTAALVGGKSGYLHRLSNFKSRSALEQLEYSTMRDLHRQAVLPVQHSKAGEPLQAAEK